MDRAIPACRQNRQAYGRWLSWLAAVVCLGIALLVLRSWIRPSLDRDEIRTARVERGAVSASISAAGHVVPLQEQVISALFDSEIVAVVATAGTEVEPGQAILRLDARTLGLESAELREELALQQNLRRGEHQSLAQSLDTSRSRLELLAIDLESRRAKLSRFQTLAKDGAVASDQLFEAELAVQRTVVEMRQLERAMTHAQQAAATQLERIALETSILRGQLNEKERQIAACTVTAPRSGVVTWALEQIGSRVNSGMPLARVADLSRFRVEAQVSDFFASRLASGLPARVEVGKESLDARVSAILPTVEGGQITLQIELEAPSHPALRPRLRVEVEVITGQVADTLALKNGPAIGSDSRQTVYRIQDGMATRTSVLFGISSRHRVQVLEGLEEGDEVILSDTRDIAHLESIRVE